MKIWQRYLLVKLMKTFFFLLFCLFVIYVIIDLSAHGVRFFSKATFFEIFLYYLNSFSILLDLFFTLTFLLATLRVLFDLSFHREIVALQMAGLSKKKLLFPFFLFAAFLSLIGAVNCEWFAPHAGEKTGSFKMAYKTKKKIKEPKLYAVGFEDLSELVYRRFDKKSGLLHDVFWVRQADDIWHMKTLHVKTLEGAFANRFTRGENRQFEKTESFAIKTFSEIPWDPSAILSKFTPYENRPLSTLFLQALGRPADERIVFSHFYYKLLSPLIAFLVLIGVGPIALRYTRKAPIFLITSVAIFALLGLKTIIDGMLILGENQVLPSYIAIFSPVALILSTTLPTFMRMR